MKKIIVLAIVAIISSCASYNKTQNTTTKAPAVKDASGNLVGYATKKDFQQEPFGSSWFNGTLRNYSTDKNTIEALKPYLKDVTIKAFMGTWCGDSKREVPKFYKILEETNFDEKQLSFVTVNREKTANGLEKGHNIERVPTFIFYKKGKEIGRFVEHSVNNASLEHDILQIVSEKGYKHAYE